MSQPAQVSLSDVKEWLRREAKPLLEPIEDKAASLMEETEARIDDTVQSSQKILENSEKEMTKNSSKTYRFARNANKFSQNIIDTISAVTVPDDFTYEKLHAFCGDLEKGLASSEQIRRGAYPYISPYFIFDRRRLDVSLKRLYDITKELRSFLTTKYAKVKTVEDAYSLVDKLLQAIDEAKQNQEKRELTEERRGMRDRQISETRQKIADIEARAELNELITVNRRIQELRQNVKHSLRYLQKPFRKLQSLARTSEVAIPLDEMNKLEDYLNDPYTALATDEDGFSKLKKILNKLDATIAQGKLKLKSTRIRKAQAQINSILQRDSFGQLQKNCKEACARKNQLLMSETMTALQDQLSQLQDQLKELRKESELVNSRSKVIQGEQERLRERTEYLRKELEKSAFQLIGKSVQVALPG